MATAYSLEPQPYVLEEDKDKEEHDQTVFMLKNLSHDEWDVLVPSITGGDGGSLSLMGSSATKILKKTMKGWENFNDSDGNPIEWSQNMKTNLNRLSAGQRMELAMEAIRRQQLTQGEEKN